MPRDLTATEEQAIAAMRPVFESIGRVRDEVEELLEAAIKVADAVAADLTRQAVEQALEPIEALMHDWKREVVIAGGVEVYDERLSDLRAAVEQARGGA